AQGSGQKNQEKSPRSARHLLKFATCLPIIGAFPACRSMVPGGQHDQRGFISSIDDSTPGRRRRRGQSSIQSLRQPNSRTCTTTTARIDAPQDRSGGRAAIRLSQLFSPPPPGTLRHRELGQPLGHFVGNDPAEVPPARALPPGGAARLSAGSK